MNYYINIKSELFMQCLPLCFFGAIGIMDTEGNLDVSHSIRLFSAGADACMVSEFIN